MGLEQASLDRQASQQQKWAAPLLVGTALQGKTRPYLWVLVGAEHVPLPPEKPEFNLAVLSLAVCGGCSMEGTCPHSTSYDASCVHCNPEPLGLS